MGGRDSQKALKQKLPTMGFTEEELRKRAEFGALVENAYRDFDFSKYSVETDLCSKIQVEVRQQIVNLESPEKRLAARERLRNLLTISGVRSFLDNDKVIRGWRDPVKGRPVIIFNLNQLLR